MRKVLVVDDAPAVLSMLKRTLTPMQAEWEMAFLGSATEALAALGQTRYDVLATDMVMPGMDGLQLLEEAKTRYPSMVRIAFSGETAKGYGLRSAGLAHQFLEKPIDGRQLQSIMTRACALRASLADEQLRHLVVNLRNLPSLPAIYQDLLEEIHSRDASLKKIAKIISGDLAMVSKILQLVNSAFFGLRATVANPEQAVALLGSETIKSLVLSMQVFSQFEGTALPGFSLDALWQHGIATSTSARRIAKEEGVPQSVVDDSFTAGLLHDIGLLLLVTNKPEEYKKVLALRREKHLPEWQAEQEIFGTTHAEVGAHLLSLWGVGETIVEAVAFHHRPNACTATECTPLVAVHVANSWHEQSQVTEEEKTPLQPDREFLSRAGLLAHLPRGARPAKSADHSCCQSPCLDSVIVTN
ncbi:MAG: HDOD domain-containing protein [Nitrospiraceae bacterium]|nr:HDOD domain-containing protein [Nitrospiraceae bacterium]